MPTVILQQVSEAPPPELDWVSILLQFGMLAAILMGLVVLVRYVLPPFATLFRTKQFLEQESDVKVALVPLELHMRLVDAVEKQGMELRRQGLAMEDIKAIHERNAVASEKTVKAVASLSRGVHKQARSIERLAESLEEHRITGNGKRYTRDS